MKISEIQNNDIPKVKELLEELYFELGEEKESIAFLTENLILELVQNGRTTILKATDLQDEIIGILTLTESQAIYCGGFLGTIDEMFVVQNFRNQKVGEKLLNKAKEIAEEKGWKRLDVTAPTDEDEATVNFYKKNGFVFTGPKLKFKLF